jgi:hypothetical protein
MRRVRWLSSVVATAVLLPASASAQAGREFTNAWLWGAKTGLMSFSTTTVKNAAAPTIGAEWLITRSRAGLYVSLDQAFFDETVGLVDGTGVGRVVEISDMRRTSFALLAFPVAGKALRPYGGVGLALNIIQDAAIRVAPEDSSDLRSFGRQVIDEKDRAAVLLIAGVQGQVGQRLAVFGQGTLMPARERFLLNERATFFLETGVRWNFGKSIERPE